MALHQLVTADMAKFGSSYSNCSKHYEYENLQQKYFTYSYAQIQDKLAYKNYHELLWYLAEHRPTWKDSVLSKDSFITSLSV